MSECFYPLTCFNLLGEYDTPKKKKRVLEGENGKCPTTRGLVRHTSIIFGDHDPPQAVIRWVEWGGRLEWAKKTRFEGVL